MANAEARELARDGCNEIVVIARLIELALTAPTPINPAELSAAVRYIRHRAAWLGDDLLSELEVRHA